jgi:hypothetical protein
MNRSMRRTLLAGAIAALVASPTWVAAETHGSPGAGAEPPRYQTDRTGTGMDAPAVLRGGTETDMPEVLRSDSIFGLTADELRDLELVEITGETAGTITDVVKDDERDALYAVISVDGEEKVVPVDRMHLVDDAPRLADPLDDVAQEYDADRYSEVDADRPMRELVTVTSLPPLPTQDPMRMEGDPKGGVPVQESQGPEPR